MAAPCKSASVLPCWIPTPRAPGIRRPVNPYFANPSQCRFPEPSIWFYRYFLIPASVAILMASSFSFMTLDLNSGPGR